jgi:hypothetical protein
LKDTDLLKANGKVGIPDLFFRRTQYLCIRNSSDIPRGQFLSNERQNVHGSEIKER